MEITKNIIDEIPEEIYDILRDIGCPSNIKGYDIIAYAIYLMVKDPDMMTAHLTKIIYPLLAKTFNSTSSRVERNIRHCIEVLYERGDWDNIQKYVGSSDITRGKLTNSEFLSRVARRVRKLLVNKYNILEVTK